MLLTKFKLLNQTKGNSVNVHDSFKGHNSYWWQSLWLFVLGAKTLFCATGCKNLKSYTALLIGITIINSCKQSAEFACLKGNVTYNIPAYILFQIGFNAGNGTQSYEYLPYSQNSVLRDLVGRGWTNGFPGRHIFRIDERIMVGNCNKDLGMYDFCI